MDISNPTIRNININILDHEKKVIRLRLLVNAIWCVYVGV